MLSQQDHPELSPREQQLIELAAEGLTDTAIAHRLGISEPTVKSYWGRVRIKLGPRNRTELVAHALREEGEQVVAELNGEIERLKSALSDSEASPLDLHRSILESAPDAVFAVGEDGKIVWLNLEAERMFGYRFDELVGLSITTLVPDRFHERHQAHMRVYLNNPVRKQMGEHLATLAIRRDGEEFAVAATLSAMNTPEGRLVACYVREVETDRAVAAFVKRHLDQGGRTLGPSTSTSTRKSES